VRIMPMFPASATAEGRQFNGAPFPATASAEGAQFNVPPFPATATAEGRQFNGAPSLTTLLEMTCYTGSGRV
jgi:hypothetical protein